MTDETSPRSIMPVVLGIALTAVFLLFLLFATRKREAEQAAVPSLNITAPAPEAVVDSPLVIRFTSTRPLELAMGGWGTSGLHLHAWVNDVQYMPAAADIQHAGDAYQWVLAAVPRGDVTIRLGWADMRHRPLAAGNSTSVPATIR